MKRLLHMLTVALLLAAVAAAVPAQESRLRTVRGQVVDKDETPIPGSVVYLKNKKTESVRTANVGEDGTYRFSGLDPNVDYEVHAEYKDSASSKRTVSSFDGRREIVIHLKINKKKD